jgi:hypothetical protein
LGFSSLSKLQMAKLSTEEYHKATTAQLLAWMRLVERYTKRSLTKQTDILPAIFGVAHSIAKNTSDELFAGLWESYFTQCQSG